MRAIETEIRAIDLTSHGENGSRPQGPLYPRNNSKTTDIIQTIL